MPLRKFQIDPPFQHQVGDEYARIGNTYKQIRNNAVIDSRTVATPAILTAQFHFGTSTVTELLEEYHMPGVTATLVDVNVAASGSITYDFSDGASLEYPNLPAVAELADSIDATPDLCRKLLITKSFRDSPDGANLTNQVGATVTIDGNASIPVQFSLND